MFSILGWGNRSACKRPLFDSHFSNLNGRKAGNSLINQIHLLRAEVNNGPNKEPHVGNTGGLRRAEHRLRRLMRSPRTPFMLGEDQRTSAANHAGERFAGRTLGSTPARELEPPRQTWAEYARCDRQRVHRIRRPRGGGAALPSLPRTGELALSRCISGS